MLLVVPAGLAGFLLHGPWVGVGLAAGLLFAFAARTLGGGPPVLAVALVLPPLLASGFSAVVPLALGALVVGWQRTRNPLVFLLGGLGFLLPVPAAWLVPALSGALLLASASGNRIFFAIPCALAALIPGLGAAWPIPVAALLFAGVGRWIAQHPANATVSWHMAGMGLLAMPAPAVLALVLAALGKSSLESWAIFGSAAAAALLGVLLLLAQLGYALFLRALRIDVAVWLALGWGGILAMFTVMVPLGATEGLQSLLPLASLLTVPAAVGAGWVYGVIFGIGKNEKRRMETFTSNATSALRLHQKRS